MRSQLEKLLIIILKFTFLILTHAGPIGLAVQGVGLQPLAC